MYTLQEMQIADKLRRDAPGGTNAFYEKWAEYIVENYVIPFQEACLGCPAEEYPKQIAELEEQLNMKSNSIVTELTPKWL